MQTVLIYSVRVVLVYFFTYLSTRILTKKAIAQMTAYEIAGLMVIGNVAAEPLVDKVMVKSVYGTGLLILLMLITSRIAVADRFTKIMEHSASVVVNNGQIDFHEIKRLRISLNVLLGMIRQQGFDRVSDIEAAVLEPNGTLSVFAKSHDKPVTKRDMNINVPGKPISMPLIMNGRIVHENLEYVGRSEIWLVEELQKQGIKDYVHEVFLAELDSSWNVIVYRK
ncbi:DUF421 domain-containing protein [Ruminiclostridium cellulolyticum]|uniref:YetF C-terminal domain-containing protein n=1 Tax=Ruminiclostridium cellulolyticum (strain ATCC 35319 / DSM 5812 / JCM 6584 / H10) TaxID=394503 RepID=B8HZY2_RUMCH|nr:DUF421 domain-containing protein [Ruminiclostridium cellulolyticum]ACL75482.1 protein of unknown function DUF421 [Ruminiclostridium cellulolyticum H10]